MKRTLTMAEIFQRASTAKTKAERLQILREEDHPAIRALLQIHFGPWKWLIPEGLEWKSSDYTDQEGGIHNNIRKMYLFIEGGHPTLQQDRREDLFVQMLEGLDSKDAKFLYDVTQGKLPPYITRKLVQEAYPGIFDGQDFQETA